ncbi:MAG: DUF445 family protein [Gemmatimonadales bacterium]|nr:MAG: DUF445 family protein [Gemmatimonadales bacterium]
MMTPEILRALLTVLFGSLAGGLTNTVAVWMLFHPHTPPKVFGIRLGLLHGAIPKNQARLASAVGRTVGNRLLTPEDLERILSDREFREAFDRRLTVFLEELLERERGSLRDTLPDEVLAEVEALLVGTADRLSERLEGWIDGPEFEAEVTSRTEAFLTRMANEPVGELLTPAREAAITSAAEEWLAGAVEREGFQGAIEDYLERGSRAILRSDRTFEDILPLGLSSSLERALAEYLPTAAQRLGRLLDDPVARARVEAALDDLFKRLLRDLRFHQRVVARLVVTEDTLSKVLDTVQEEGAERLSEMLRDPEVQTALARGVNDAVVDLLRRPVSSVLGEADDPTIREARAALADWVLGIARDPETREFLLEKLRGGMGRASEGTWGELLRRIPPEKVAAGVVAAARSDAARRAYRETTARLLSRLLDRPIGRPADWLPTDGVGRIERALSGPLWEWLQGQVPHVVDTLDVARRVEEKVLDYPVMRMEELVRRVTERELKLIVRLGYGLGAMIGALLVILNAMI